jgi:hypothetical protein
MDPRSKEDLFNALAETMEADGPAKTDFNQLALQLFAWQYARMQPYRRLCDSRGLTPETVKQWQAVPPVPTAMFKQMTLFAGAQSEIQQSFSTSGTTGTGEKGRSHFSALGLRLMETSIRLNASKMLFPDEEKMHILVLAPSPQMAPEMIMAWGMQRLIEHFGTDQSRFLIGKEGLDVPLLVQLLKQFQQEETPVTLIGASFGFVNLLEGLKAKGLSFRLPLGSRTMDAGGYKGRSRELCRDELDAWLEEGFGVAPGMSVNLLGMTELASQLYDDTIAATLAGESPKRHKINCPWTKTAVVDPLSLEFLPDGQEGCLMHMDLANLDTPFCVLTDDLGVRTDTGFKVLGRLSADQSRGCSLTVDEMTRGASNNDR